MTLGPHLAAAALAAAALAAAAPRARADDDAARAEARHLLDDGVRLYQAGRLEAALDRFERAYLRTASPGLLLNIGTTQRRLGREAEAANTYQRYLDDPDADPELVPDVEAGLRELDQRLGILLLAPAPGAEVQVGAGPWRAADDVRLVRVGPGAQTVRMRRGELSFELTVVVSAGERREVRVPPPARDPATGPRHPSSPPAARSPTLDPSTATAATAGATTTATAAPPRHPGRARRLAGLTAGGAGLVALGVGAALGLRARGRFDDARVLCEPGGCQPGADYDRAVELADAGRADRRLAFIVAGAGVAALAGGAALWLTAPGRAAAPAPATRVDVSLIPGGAGLTVTGRF